MASLRRNSVVSILFIVFGGPGIILVYVPLWITHFRIPSDERRWQMAMASALIAAGVLPLIESAYRFVFVGRGTLAPITRCSVGAGWYRHVRNPMYVGVVTALVGEGLLFESRAIAVYALLVGLATHLFVRLYEEPTLARRFRRAIPGLQTACAAMVAASGTLEQRQLTLEPFRLFGCPA